MIMSSVLREDPESQTIPATKSQAEKDFDLEVGSGWGQKKFDTIIANPSYLKQKATAIIKHLKDNGFMDDPIIAKATNTNLVDWLQSLDQDDLVVSNAKDLAMDFIETV